jgi:electron transfer flavoprotein alpha subunit
VTVLVLIEHAGGGVDELSLQSLTLARELAAGEPLDALLVGEGGREAAVELGAHGVVTAYVAEDERAARSSCWSGWTRAPWWAPARTAATRS